MSTSVKIDEKETDKRIKEIAKSLKIILKMLADEVKASK